MTFYEQWLERSVENERDLGSPPVLSRGVDLQWCETPHDTKAAVVIGRANGFPTQGTVLVQAEIPVGWHTGAHVHGEEAIYILDGVGCIVQDGIGYDFSSGTTIHVPYGTEHQLINVGDRPVSYLCAMTTDLDLYVKLGRVEQRSEKGEGNRDALSSATGSSGDFDRDGRRVVLHAGERINLYGARPKAPGEGGHAHTHGAVWLLMGGDEVKTDLRSGFRAKAAAMTHIFEDLPHTSSHRHAHTEAMLYVLEGTGYSDVDGVRYDWEAGDAVFVPPKMTVHEHFNPSELRTRTLRIEFGIRYFYEALWSGYSKVEVRESAVAR